MLNHFSQSLVNLSYDAKIEKILNAFAESQFLGKDAPNIYFEVLATLLKDDPSFKQDFSNDHQRVPLFIKIDKDFPEKLKTYVKDSQELIELCEQIKTLKLDETYAKEQIMKMYGFKEPLNHEQEDLIKIVLFLSDPENVIPYLNKLEKILEEKAKTLEVNGVKQYDEQNKKFIAYEDNKPLKHHKLLSNYLSQWAKENGFEGITKIYKLLPGNTFFKMLEQGRSPTIDKGARAIEQHGEWSHFLQLWCVMEHNNDLTNSNEQLTCKVPDLLGWIGKQKGLIWKKTFDSEHDPEHWPVTGFRVPNDLNKYLSGDDAKVKLPVLHQLIKGREAKGAFALHKINEEKRNKIPREGYVTEPFEPKKR